MGASDSDDIPSILGAQTSMLQQNDTALNHYDWCGGLKQLINVVKRYTPLIFTNQQLSRN